MQQPPRQGQVSGQSQPILMEPPQVITSKDILYLKDALSWQLLAMKKCAHFAQESTDPEIKRLMDETGRMHQAHYQQLLQCSQINNTQMMQQVQQMQSEAQSQGQQGQQEEQQHNQNML